MSLDMNTLPQLVRAVRDGQSAPVTCASCGCRLDPAGTSDEGLWFHFGRLGGRDARGCRTACIEAAHDRTGKALLAA